jgi:membrane-bound inhibitor of C-type lysozyme
MLSQKFQHGFKRNEIAFFCWGGGVREGIDGDRFAVCAFSLMLVTLQACSSVPRTMSQSPRLVKYACDNGEFVEVRFAESEGAATLIRAGSAVALKQQTVASGFEYSNGPNTIRGKGEELRVEIGRMVPISCRAQ